MNSRQRSSRRFPWQLQLLVDLALTPAVYFGLQGRFGLSTVQVLLIAVAAGLVWAVFGLVRTRSVNAVSLCMIGGLVVGAVLTGMTGDPRFGVAKDSIYTGVFGAALLLSLAASKPLMFHLIRPFATRDNNPVDVEDWNRSWASPLFRRCMRVMTVAWGIGLLIEAGTRIVLVLTVSLNTASALSPVLTAVLLVTLMTWTGSYGRRAGEARRIAEAPAV